MRPDFDVLTFSTGGASHGRYIRASKNRRLRTGWTRRWSAWKHLEMVAHESSHPARLPRSFPSQPLSLEAPEQRGVVMLSVGRKEKKRDTCGLKSGSVGKERRQTDGFSLNMYKNLF